MLKDPDVKSVLVNVIAGITRCDEVAKGIVEAIKRSQGKKLLVVRLVGTNESVGQRILAEAGVSVLSSMEEAAKLAVEFATEKKK